MSTIPSTGVKQNPSYTRNRTKEALSTSCPPTFTMPATASTILARCIAWFTGKSSRLTSEGLVEETEPLYIRAPPTLQDAHPGAAISALPQQSPLALLEHSLLCTAQGVVGIFEEPQTIVLRTAVATTKVTVADFVEPTPTEVEILAPTPTISLTPPTPKKRKSRADPTRSFTPFQNIATAPGTLRPSGKWHGKKNTSSRRVRDKENLAPAIAGRPLKTREERLRAYTPPARLLGLRQGQENSPRFLTSDRFLIA